MDPQLPAEPVQGYLNKNKEGIARVLMNIFFAVLNFLRVNITEAIKLIFNK
jgi:hypothetical protein